MTPTAGVENWCATLQQASQLESERGFGDLVGRRETFSAFIVRSLQEGTRGLTEEERRALAEMAGRFASYPTDPPERRARLVSQLRQRLHQLRCRYRPPLPVSPPRLRLQGRPDSGPSTHRLEPDSPLLEIPGVGPKLAGQLAGLGLLVVRDLVQHYPRDYLDYARLVRITDLVPGSTATIVARVRRCHAFASPRNPNLAILELQLHDGTGRLRVSRFLAGRRFTSPGALRLQQNQYPVGARC